MASSLATTTGLRPGRTSTLVPSFNRRVRPAATARPTNGSGAGPVRRSLSHSESKPRRSSPSTTAGNRSASPAGVCVPSPKPMRTFTPPLPSPAAGRSPRSEDDQPLGQLGDLVDVAGPGPGGQVLPPAVREDDDDRAGVDLAGHPGRAGHGRPAGDAGEHPDVGEPAGPLDPPPGPDDALAVEQVGPAPLLVDGRDVALVQVPQALDPLAERRLDGHHLDVGVLLLEVAPDAHQRAGGAEPGDEVRDLGAVPPDLRARALVVGPGVGLVGVLVEEGPLGVLVG